MKKKILLYLLILLPIVAIGQSKKITINWDSFSEISAPVKKKVSKGDYKERVAAAVASINLRIDDEMIRFAEQWEDTGIAQKQSLQVSNVVYGNLSPSEVKKINTNLVPSTFSAEIRTSKARDILYTVVSATPIIRENGVLKKVLSFSITYQKNAERASRRVPLSNSVLANGNFFKFKVERNGVYRLTKSFLDDLGLETGGINPRSIKVYGHGGKPLPLLLSENTQFDIPEVAIKVVGEEDGSFDSGDYVLFYGTGTLGYDAENDTNINPYADDSYYYVTVSDGNGLRVSPMADVFGFATQQFSSYHGYKFHELDEESPSKVGRRWFGNRFDIENQQNFDFSFPNIVGGSMMDVTIKTIATSETTTSMAVSVNGTSLNPFTYSVTNQSTLISSRDFIGEIPAPGDNAISVGLEYSNAGNPSSNAYLDYISIKAELLLQGGNGQFTFINDDASTTNGIGEYTVSNANTISEIWDVTNASTISAVENTEANATLSFKAILGEDRTYVALDATDFYTPISVNNPRVTNQNIKGTVLTNPSGSFQDVDYLIVTAPYLLQPALRLADHHRQLSGMRVKVVTTDKVYEEFSSGKQDIGAIRNLTKYVYDNASSPENRIKYLCLFGDSSVDYKNRLSNNNNVVPSFHTYKSFSSSGSFISDDFFGFMDEEEGTFLTSDKLDIAVGRIVTDDVLQANQLVDKIVNYSSERAYGNWRNNFVLISDDVDIEWEYESLEVTLDGIGDQIEAEKSFINVKKIHTDAFQQQTSAGGDRYPDVNKRVKEVIDLGSLIITYFGHGGEDGVAKEFIFTKNEGEALQNSFRYPCIVTVTCEYTKFDNPLRVTAGELIYQNPRGGAISMITTTRSIGVRLGVDYNEVLAPLLFGYGTTNYNTPAEALRLAKNQLDDESLRRVVFYVGDPAMQLAFPKPQVRLTTLNGAPIAGNPDMLKALGRVTIGGEVLDVAGNLDSDYNGVLEAKIFDKKVNRRTLGNDGTRGGPNNELLILDFQTLGEGLFNGQASVQNGQFEFEFVVPRDIQIPVGAARASLYVKEEGVLEDRTGVSFGLRVGGLNEDAPEDTQGPDIQLFMNDESFVSGGITNDSPILIAKLEDLNGLNTASGIGHDMIAVLDGDEANPIVVNEYYQGDVDDYTRGTMNFKLRDIEEGLHTLTFKAWDVYNNSSTAEIQFVVAGSDELKITRVLNYPNPFVDYTEFWFNHNRPLEPLEVQVQVFTVTGKVVWTKNQIITTEGFLSREIGWDGRDDFGDKIGKGTYVYKITVKSSLTNKRVEKFEKLVIL